MSDAVTLRWRDGALEPAGNDQHGDDQHGDHHGDARPARLLAADSWLVVDGAALAVQLHVDRFLAAASSGPAPATAEAAADLAAFVAAALAAVPREGEWFPRLDAREVGGAIDAAGRDGAVGRGDAAGEIGAPELSLRLRPAPARHRSVVLATHRGRDPRTRPRVKGPDLDAMLRIRTGVRSRGADEAVLLERDGSVAEGSTTCLVWWRGDALCLPEDDIARVDSVTVRSLLALAAALGIDVLRERATPAELEGLEVWALNALHGIRIVSRWVDGPSTAEQPGRLELWRRRLDALRRPLPAVATAEAGSPA